MDRKKKYDEKFIRKTIRFTPDEFEKIEEQRIKTNLDFTSFCKSAILKKKVKTKEEENFNRDLIYQVNKIGVNLNQIAHKTNMLDLEKFKNTQAEIIMQLINSLIDRTDGCHNMIVKHIDAVWKLINSARFRTKLKQKLRH